MVKKVKQATAKKAKTRTKVVTKYVNTGNSLQTSHTAYAAARLSPFSDQSIGARVPDEYSFPTDTRRVRALYRVNTGSAIGQLDLAVTSNPIVGLASLNTPNGVTITGPKSQRFIKSRNNGVTVLGTSTLYPAVEESEVEAAFATYRVVGYGVRMRSSSNYTNVGGRVTTVTVPNTGRLPTFTSGLGASGYEFGLVQNASGVVEQYNQPGLDVELCRRMGLPPNGSGGVATSIVNFPTSRNATMAEVLSMGGAEMVGKSTSPHAKWFRSTDPTAGNLSFVPVDGDAAGNQIDTTRMNLESDVLSMAGWTSLAAQFRELPANTSLEFEVVWHLEGITQGAALLPTSVAPFVDPAYMNRVDAVTAMAPDTGAIASSGSKLTEGMKHLLLGSGPQGLTKASKRAFTPGSIENRLLNFGLTIGSNSLFPGSGPIVSRAFGALSSMVPR